MRGCRNGLLPILRFQVLRAQSPVRTGGLFMFLNTIVPSHIPEFAALTERLDYGHEHLEDLAGSVIKETSSKEAVVMLVIVQGLRRISEELYSLTDLTEVDEPEDVGDADSAAEVSA